MTLLWRWFSPSCELLHALRMGTICACMQGCCTDSAGSNKPGRCRSVPTIWEHAAMSLCPSQSCVQLQRAYLLDQPHLLRVQLQATRALA